MQTINVRYEEVYTKTTEMRRRLAAGLRDMDMRYRQALSQLRHVDGASAAAIRDNIECNREKARVTAETLDKLIAFMANSTRQIEMEEIKIRNTFNASRATFRRR